MRTLLILWSILLTQLSFSQLYTTACDAEHSPISTDFQNPFYPQELLPYGTTGANFQNGLDWNSYSGFNCEDMSFAGIPLVGMTALTSTQTSGGYYAYIYASASAISRKHLHTEGWELLSVNLGYFPDNVTMDQTIKFRSMPFVVLYNRYQGIIRVFVSMGPDKTINEAADAIAITLRIDKKGDNVNGLLRLYNGNDLALNQKTEVENAQMLSKAVNAQGDWASCDFQVALDPCVCNYPSNMTFEFQHIKKQHIELIGRSVALNTSIMDPNVLSLTPQEFLSGYKFDYDGEKKGESSAGLVIEQSINGIINEYIKKYEKYQSDLKAQNKHNEKVKKNLAYLRFAKAAIIFVATSGANIGDIATWNSLQNQGLAFSANYIANGEATTFDDGNWFKTVMSAFQTIKTKVNGQSDKIDENQFFKVLKSIFGDEVDTYISKNWELMAEPTQPVKPTNTVTYTEMSFKGKIETVQAWDGPLFATPGTFGTSMPNIALSGDNIFYYPNYNEPLGVFALLNSPKIKISETIQDENQKGEFEWISRIDVINPMANPPIYGTVWDIESKRYQNWTHNYQFKLDEELKFTFNNVLDIKGYSISGFLDIEAKLKNSTSSNSLSASYIDPNFTTNLESKKNNFEEYEKIYKRTLLDLPYENGANHFLSSQGTISSAYIRINSPLLNQDSINSQSVKLDINDLYENVSSLGLKNELVKTFTKVLNSNDPKPNFNAQTGQWVFPNFNQMNVSYPVLESPSNSEVKLEFNIVLKLIVDVVFQSKNELGINNKTTLILSYKVNPDDINYITGSDILPNLEGSTHDITQYAENLFFETTNFDGSTIENCKISGNEYTCQAWNNISISGNLTTQNGYKVKLIAGNEIVEYPESIVSPEIELSINPVLIYSFKMPQVSQTYLSDFCKNKNPNGKNYQANISSKSFLDTTIQTNNFQGQLIPESPFSFQLFPNPTHNTTTVLLEGPGSKEARISVYDLSGKEMNIRMEASENHYNLDVSTLAKGLYFVQVSTFGEAQTKQLIIH